MTFAILLLAATFTRPFERVASIDPKNAQTVPDAHVAGLLYETPLKIDYAARPYRILPSYTELPEVSADGLVYRLKVRGKRSAADLVRSLNRLQDPTAPGAWVLKDVESIRRVANDAVEIRLKRRVPYFPWLLTLSSTGVIDEKGEGTGPYRLVRWRKNYEMVFERKEPQTNGFNTVRYLVIDDFSTQWLMFLKGELDFLGERVRDDWDLILDGEGRLRPAIAAQGIGLHADAALEVLYTGINMKDPLLGTNKKLRQALVSAFDYPAWERFYGHRIAPASTPVPPGIARRLEGPSPYGFNLDRARVLLQEAGYPDGVDPATGRRLVIHLAIGRVDQASRASSELMASFYDRIGIKLEIDYMPWDIFLKAVNEGRVQLFRMGWKADYPDAQNFLQLFYGPYRAPGINHVSYENAEYDRAYENGDYERCQRILQEDCPWILTHYYKEFSLVGPKVGNFMLSDFPYGHEEYYENALP